MAIAKPSPLSTIPAFAGLNAEEHAALMRHARSLRAPAGRLLMKKGDASGSLMILLEGRLRVSAVSLEGRGFTFRLVEPVEMVGEIGVLDGGPRSADVTSVTEARLLVLQASACRDAMARYPAIAQAMIRLLCARLRATSAGLEQVATQRLPARMAALLLKLAAEYGQPGPGGSIQLPMRLSQGEIGTLVAATREAVNKQLMQWREEAMLEMVAGRIELRRAGALAALLE
jgi:CRP-like cAMP-binding protein